MTNTNTRKETVATVLLSLSLILALSIAGLLGLALTGSASAQEVPGNATETPEPESDATETPEEGPGEYVEPGLSVESTYLPSEGAVELTLHTESPRSITLTDAGAVREGGEVPRRTLIAERGTSTVRMPVTEVDGLAAVTIGTSNKLYAVVLEDSSGLLDVPAPSDRAALLIGIGLPPVLGYLWVRRRQSLDDSGVVRVE